MAFRAQGSPLQEMQRLERLRERDPESATNVVANGKLLVQWAEEGAMRELQCALEHLDESCVFAFYSVRMFRVACAARRLDVLTFMLANGFDLQQACMRDVLHTVIHGITDITSAEAAQPLIRFLIDSGVDVNWQRPSDFYTALHLACSRSLCAIAYLLILYGADVNAIAANDEMPLACAERASEAVSGHTVSSQSDSSKLISLLLECGARRSWRKTPPVSSASSTQPRIVSFSSHCTLSALSFASPSAGSPCCLDSHAETDEDDESTLVQAFSQGIQLDTSPAA